MKKSLLALVASLLSLSITTVFADSVIVKETTTWRSVPITVDAAGNTYTVSGAVPTDTTEYYYSYPGHRCFATKRNVVGVDGTVIKASVAGGVDIYCYPE